MSIADWIIIILVVKFSFAGLMAWHFSRLKRLSGEQEECEKSPL